MIFRVAGDCFPSESFTGCFQMSIPGIPHDGSQVRSRGSCYGLQRFIARGCADMTDAFGTCWEDAKHWPVRRWTGGDEPLRQIKGSQSRPENFAGRLE